MDIEKEVKAAMQGALDHLQQDLKTIRTGRAHSSMLDKVVVEAYGSQVPIKQLATISVPESHMILVTPFDGSMAPHIKKGIELAQLGLNPMVDGKVVRVPVPSMDEALRKQKAKQAKELAEKSKVAIREVRRKYNDLVRKQKGEGTLPEDQMKKFEKMIQEWTDRFCKEADLAASKKEEEILTL